MISELYCSFCGNKQPIPRPDSEQREKYHVKTMHCFKCKHDTPFIEIREKDSLDKKGIKVISNGILAFYFNKYGYDFLKLLIYIRYARSYNEYKDIVNTYIWPYKDMTPIFEQEKYLKIIVDSIYERHTELYNEIIRLLECKTVFLKYYD